MDEQLTCRPPPLIDWAVAAMALAGQTRSGDLHVVKTFPGGTLVGVVDGLGHGEEAGEAADIAVATLEAHAQEPVDSLVKRCHEKLRGTRGAAITLASFRAFDLAVSWLGVGNVEGVLLRGNGHASTGRESIVQRGGVVGYSLPPLLASVFPVSPGDTLILATDGIRAGFAQGLATGEPPQQMADRIFARSRRGTDDALVLVARVTGGAP